MTAICIHKEWKSPALYSISAAMQHFDVPMFIKCEIKQLASQSKMGSL